MRAALVLLALLFLGCAQLAETQAGTSEMPLGAPVCQVTFSPDPELEVGAATAAERWSAATGCDVRIGDGGVPIVLADAEDVRDSTGHLKRAITEIHDGAPVRIAYRRGPLLPWTVETMLTHEMGHALGAHTHTPSNIMADTTELYAKIDEDALDLVCAELPCLAFNPELLTPLPEANP